MEVLGNRTALSRNQFHMAFEAVFLDDSAQDDGHGHGHARRAGSGARHRLMSHMLAAGQHAHVAHHARADVAQGCASSDQLFDTYDVDGNGALSRDELRVASSAVFVMAYQGCTAVRPDCAAPTTAERWGYGILATIAVSLTSLLGVIFLPVDKDTFRKVLLEVMVAFAVGALLGDAILHLIPIVLEIHGHGSVRTGDDLFILRPADADADGANDHVWPLLLVLLGVLFFFVLERIILRLLGSEGHSHGMAASLPRSSSNADADTAVAQHVRYYVSEQTSTGGTPVDEPYGGGGASRKAAGRAGSSMGTDDAATTTTASEESLDVEEGKDIATVGYLNLIADGFHNLTDGLALGAAFSSSTALGWTTTLAVIFHEIPQEVGDFGVLVHAGFSRPWALTWNLASGLVSLLGCIIGLAIGEAVNDSERWILAFTAGGFFYIALADMLPELMHQRGRNHSVIQITAMLIGFGVMLILGFYELEATC